MRMRRKKHLDEKLAELAPFMIPVRIDRLNYHTAVLEKDYIDPSALFGRSAPLYMEIGCGKGRFAAELASREPDIDIIAVERSANVIADACFLARDRGLKNLLFMNTGAEYLAKFIPGGALSRIYLNFSCPYPKTGYEKRRLTAPFFIESYRTMLAPGAELHLKTDSADFFSYSIEQLLNGGFTIKETIFDLHAYDTDNIETEYEERFAAKGLPIYKLTAAVL